MHSKCNAISDVTISKSFNRIPISTIALLLLLCFFLCVLRLPICVSFILSSRFFCISLFDSLPISGLVHIFLQCWCVVCVQCDLLVVRLLLEFYNLISNMQYSIVVSVTACFQLYLKCIRIVFGAAIVCAAECKTTYKHYLGMSMNRVIAK